MRDPITFTVTGMEPAPQGSKRMTRYGNMIEACPRVRPWRKLVRQAAVAAGVPMIHGPVAAHFVFRFARPKGHFRANGELKPSAPAYHAVPPDISKLQRSTEEELSKLLIEDDSRIAVVGAEKRYCVMGEKPGATVTLAPLPATVAAKEHDTQLVKRGHS